MTLHVIHSEPTPVESVIQTIRDMLAMAERGEILSIAACAHLNDNHTASFSSGISQLHIIIGGLAILQAQLIEASLEGSVPIEAPSA